MTRPAGTGSADLPRRAPPRRSRTVQLETFSGWPCGIGRRSCADVSTLISTPVDRWSEHSRFEEAPTEARFATSVAAFGEILRGGRHTGSFAYDDVLRIASAARGEDAFGYRTEFLQLVRSAKTASAMRPLRQ